MKSGVENFQALVSGRRAHRRRCSYFLHQLTPWYFTRRLFRMLPASSMAQLSQLMAASNARGTRSFVALTNCREFFEECVGLEQYS